MRLWLCDCVTQWHALYVIKCSIKHSTDTQAYMFINNQSMRQIDNLLNEASEKYMVKTILIPCMGAIHNTNTQKQKQSKHQLSEKPKIGSTRRGQLQDKEISIPSQNRQEWAGFYTMLSSEHERSRQQWQQSQTVCHFRFKSRTHKHRFE